MTRSRVTALVGTVAVAGCLIAAAQALWMVDATGSVARVATASSTSTSTTDDVSTSAALRRTAGTLVSTVGHLPALAGMHRPRTWLVLLQNPAEARGSGGLVGGYVVLKADRGRVSVLQTGTSADLESSSIPLDGVDPDELALYGSILQQWNGLNVTPDFPTVATLARSGMRARGVDVDGVIAVDPTAVAALMSATGPVTVDGRTLTADSIAGYFQVEEYTALLDPRERDRVGMAIVRAVVDAARSVTEPSGLASTLPGLLARLPSSLMAAADAIAAGHVRVWSSDPVEQAWLASTPVGAVLPTLPGSRVDVVFINAAGNKADAFVTTTVDYAAAPCSPSAAPRSRVTVTLRNDMPLGLPTHDYGRRDREDAPSASTSMLVQVIAPVGARSPQATLGGAPIAVEPDQLGPRPAWLFTVELPRGQTVTLDVTFAEPASATAEGADPQTNAPPTMDTPPTVGVTTMAIPTRTTTSIVACR